MRDAAWALVQYRLPDDPRTHVGMLTGGRVVAAPPMLGDTTLMAVLADWAAYEEQLRAWAPDTAATADGAQLIAPLTYPGKVLCAGANYYSHAAEMGTARPDPSAEPFFFLKPPHTTVIGPGEPIPYPAYPGVRLDWEAELAVVIGRPAKDVPPDRAREHIAGYLAANDLSARDRVVRPDSVSPHFAYDWLAHKGQDGFCPLGPGIVPAWQIPDPQDLALRLSVNGTVKQDSSTADMVVGVDELVAAASRVLTLQPGDVILTGTPAGVGMPRGEFLAAGDTVLVEIDAIGRLENHVCSGSTR